MHCFSQQQDAETEEGIWGTPCSVSGSESKPSSSHPPALEPPPRCPPSSTLRLHQTPFLPFQPAFAPPSAATAICTHTSGTTCVRCAWWPTRSSWSPIRVWRWGRWQRPLACRKTSSTGVKGRVEGRRRVRACLSNSQMLWREEEPGYNVCALHFKVFFYCLMG